LLAILCNDGRAVPFELNEAERHYKSVSKTSSFGSLFASIRIACSCVSCFVLLSLS
jgi:hypothetical protein